MSTILFNVRSNWLEFQQVLIINGVPRRRFTADVSLMEVEDIMNKLLNAEDEHKKQLLLLPKRN